jgi:hypothetical protein
MASEEGEVNPMSQKSVEEYVPTLVIRDEHAEGQITRLIEHQAAKLPSDLFLFTALGAMVLSVALELTGHTRASRFIGMWPPAILTMGMYNKLVKVLGPR